MRKITAGYRTSHQGNHCNSRTKEGLWNLPTFLKKPLPFIVGIEFWGSSCQNGRASIGSIPFSGYAMNMRRALLAILLLCADPTWWSLRSPIADLVPERCCCCERGKCLCGCDRQRESSQDSSAPEAICPCGRETPLPAVPARCTEDLASTFVGHVEGASPLAPVDFRLPLQFRAVHDPPVASALSTIVLLI